MCHCVAVPRLQSTFGYQHDLYPLLNRGPFHHQFFRGLLDRLWHSYHVHWLLYADRPPPRFHLPRPGVSPLPVLVICEIRGFC